MKIIVVGLGSMGKRRIKLLQRCDTVDMIIGVDSREDRRVETQNLFRIHTYEDINSALRAHSDIDSSFVCTSPLTHSSIISTLLNNNLNVFTEINLVKDGYQENIQLANSKNLTLFLSSTFMYREEVKYIRKQVAGNDKLNYIYHIGQYLPDWHPWENYKDFFVEDKRTNGCREILAIELPWILETFGDVKKLNILSDKMSQLSIEYNDNFMIQILHNNGNKGTLVVDVVSPKPVRNLEVYGENVYYSWNGSPSSLVEFNSHKRIVEQVKLLEVPEHMDGYGSFITENAYLNEIQEFIEVVNNKLEPLYSFEKDFNVLNLIDTIETCTQ